MNRWEIFKDTLLAITLFVLCWLCAIVSVMIAVVLADCFMISRAHAQDTPKISDRESSPTQSQITYGNALFHAKTLSTTGEKSCASCHISSKGSSDDGPVSEGVSRVIRNNRGVALRREPQFGIRRAMPIEDAIFKEDLFLDGRAKLALGQATQPIQAQAEMGNQTLGQAFGRIAQSQYFQRKSQEAFGRGVNVQDGLVAIAMFERTIIHDEAPIDRFSNGQTWVFGKLDSDENKGRRIFYGKGRCTECHYGSSLRDGSFHVILGRTRDRNGQLDTGLGKISGKQEDNFKFATPTLRDVAKRAPYFHAGQAKDMAEAVAFIDAYLRLGLSSEEEIDLVSFMNVAFESYHPPTYSKPADMPEDE